MSQNRMLPVDGLPQTGYPSGETVAWLHGDRPAGCVERDEQPVAGDSDIVYSFNSLGYRSPEFHESAEVRIIAIGCSYVFGYGLAREQIFHERFAARLRGTLSKSVVLWNLGLPGASNDYITRLLYLAVPRLDPHIVLINFTHAARREYLSVQNKYVSYFPSYTPADAVVRDIFSHFQALSSPYDDQLNFYRNYKAVEVLLTGRCWLYSSMYPKETEPLAEHMDPRRNVGPFRLIDKARDGGHPGPESNRLLADLYWDRFVAIAGPESLVKSGLTAGP